MFWKTRKNTTTLMIKVNLLFHFYMTEIIIILFSIIVAAEHFKGKKNLINSASSFSYMHIFQF